MARIKHIKVRFNLSRGKYFMCWKIQYPDKRIEYYHPTYVQLILTNCQLKNNRKVAEKIFNGANKEVCAWILCEDLKIISEGFNQSDVYGSRVRYNPKIKPNWLLDGNNVDGVKFKCIKSVDYGLYIIN